MVDSILATAVWKLAERESLNWWCHGALFRLPAEYFLQDAPLVALTFLQPPQSLSVKIRNLINEYGYTMSAEQLGRRLLEEVEEGNLDDVSRSIPLRSPSGLHPFRISNATF